LMLAAVASLVAQPLRTWAAAPGGDGVVISTPTPPGDLRMSTMTFIQTSSMTVIQRSPILNISTSPLNGAMLRDIGEDLVAPSSAAVQGEGGAEGLDVEAPAER